MKLCIVTSSYPQSAQDPAAAAGLFVQSFASAVARQGCNVTVLTQDRGLDAHGTVNADGVRLVTYSWLGRDKRASYLRPSRPGDAIKMYSLVRQGERALKNLHAKEKFDHILAMWAAPGGYLARKLKRSAGIPYTVWCLGSDIWVYGKMPFFGRIIGRVVQDADFAYADGLKLAADACELAGRDVAFLPSSRKLDTSLVEPVDLPNVRPRFLFIGRYAKVKGVDVLLEAFARYLSAGRQGALYLFGGGPEEQKIRARAREEDLRQHVYVGGYADERTVVSYLAASDLAVIPSRLESIPVMLSDALQMGKPLIVTDVGDMGSLVRESGAGWVVKSESADELCQAMESFSVSDASTLAEAVSATAGRFNIDFTAQTWLSAVQSASARRND